MLELVETAFQVLALAGAVLYVMVVVSLWGQ